MANWGDVEFEQLIQLQERIQNMTESEADAFMIDCVKSLAKRLLRKVKLRTPVGVYGDEDGDGDGNTGGTLRINWHISSIKKSGNCYEIIVINKTEYASYVENGHRQEPGRYVPVLGKCLKSAWVEGVFMLKISEEEIQKIAPQLLEKKLKQKLKEVFND